ncbi:MAG: hypothetical protein AAF570_28050, partial [Bacteroidota bacterium]
MSYFALLGCGGGGPADPAKRLVAMPEWKFPYDLNSPGKKYKLPGKLVEISGLTWVSPNVLSCVQDET